LITFTCSSGEVIHASEIRATRLIPTSLHAAIQIGGRGFWNGLGVIITLSRL